MYLIYIVFQKFVFWEKNSITVIFQLTPITHLAPFGGFINHLGVLKPEIYLVVENIQFTKKEKQCNNLLGFFSNLCIQDSGDKWKSVQLKYFSQFFIYSNFIALCEEYRDM